MKLELILECDPKPLARARASNGHQYYTQAKQDEMNELSWAIARAIQDSGVNRATIEQTIASEPKTSVKMDFYLTIPKSFSKRKRDKMDLEPHTIKPDLDNLIKNVLDRGNGVLWKDDKVIRSIQATKSWRHTGFIYLVVEYE